MPRWLDLDLGYHIREAGATLQQDAQSSRSRTPITYVEQAMRARPSTSMTSRAVSSSSTEDGLFEEIAKYRAARRTGRAS